MSEERITAFHGTSNLNGILEARAVWCPALVMSLGEETTFNFYLTDYKRLTEEFSTLARNSPATMKRIESSYGTNPSIEEIADDLEAYGLENYVYDSEFEKKRSNYKEQKRLLYVYLGDYNVAKEFARFTYKKDVLKAILGFSLPQEILRNNMRRMPMVLKKIELSHLTSVHVFPEKVKEAKKLLKTFKYNSIPITEIIHTSL